MIASSLRRIEHHTRNEQHKNDTANPFRLLGVQSFLFPSDPLGNDIITMLAIMWGGRQRENIDSRQMLHPGELNILDWMRRYVRVHLSKSVQRLPLTCTANRAFSRA